MKKQLLFMFTALCSITAMAQVPNYVPTTGLVGWWPFNGNANDVSGNGNNGAVNGSSLTSDRNSISNTAYSFNGTSSYIQINLINALNTTNTNGLTLSGWTNMTSLSNQPQSIIFMVDNLNNGFNTGYDYTSTKLYGQAGNAGAGAPIFISSLNTVSSNNWYNVVMTCDFNTNTSKFYINGVLQSQSSVTLITPLLTKIFIGSSYNQVWYQNGKLDDIGIWNRVLTQQEITALYVACTNSITAQPGNQTANVNTTAQFYVTSSNTSATYQWQQNSGTGFANLSNFGQFSGVTNDTLRISNVTLAQSNYGYRCIIGGGCPDTSNVALLTVNNNVGVTEINNTNSVSISPNPFTAQTVITFSNEQKNTTVKIIDVVGKEIKTQTFSGKKLIIEKGELNNGIYFVQITDENKNTIIKKIVVE